MKKLFSVLMPATLMLLGFCSCEKQSENAPEAQPAFRIEVDYITATTAKVTIFPSDPDIYYYFDVITEESLSSGVNETTVAGQMKLNVEADKHVYPHYLSRGVDYWEYLDLRPDTRYGAYAMELDSLYRPVGKWTLVHFSTPKLEIVETVSVTGGGELVDRTEDWKVFQVNIRLDHPKGAFLSLAFDGESPEGTFTINNVNFVLGAWYVLDERNNHYYSIASVHATGSFDESHTQYHFVGEAEAGNGVKFNIDVTCPIEEKPEPPIPDGKQPLKLKYFKFSKK